jgi:flagellar biosynthetic protein FlhB
MADEEDKDQKTELPTQRKLEKALERGDVAKSQEIVSFCILGAATLSFMIAAAPAARDLTMRLRGFIANMHLISFDKAGLMALGWASFAAVMLALAAPFLFGLAAGLIGNMIQHKPVLSAESLTPKLSRLSPLSGLKRMFGKEALVNFVKGLLKISIVGSLIVAVLWPYRGSFESMASLDVAAIAPKSHVMILKLMGAVLAIYFLLAILDLLYQRHAWIERQKMSRQELKEEFKEQEGNPEIKAKLAQLRRQRARQRMMAAVPKASVVIMNPTHYAVALSYQPGMDAPVCVAKGLDELALRIKSVALEHEVPVIENPPLARALHAAVELDQTIPEEHYKAVAEVIGYVMRLKRRA